MSADEEVLEFLFESKRKGGGPVKHVQLNRQMKWAIIEFCDTGAVETVMSKLPITLMGTELEIRPYTPLLPGGVVISELDVRGLPKELTDSLLTKDIERIVASNEVSSAEYEFDNDEYEVTEQNNGNVVKDLKPVQLRMLKAIEYPRSISDAFPNVKVKLDIEKNEVLFSGENADIEPVKLNFYATLSSFSVCMFDDIPASVLEFYQSERVVEYINQKLSTNKLVCAWEIQPNDLIVCSFQTDIIKCSNIIRASVKTESFLISKESAAVSLSKKWQDHLAELRKHNDLACKVAASGKEFSVELVLTDDRAQGSGSAISSNIKDFFKRNVTIKTENITLDQLSSKLTALYTVSKRLVREALELVVVDLSIHFVKIELRVASSGSLSVDISGTVEGRELAKQEIKNRYIWYCF